MAQKPVSLPAESVGTQRRRSATLQNNSTLRECGLLDLLDGTTDGQTPLMHAAALHPKSSFQDLLTGQNSRMGSVTSRSPGNRRGSAVQIVKALLDETHLTQEEINRGDAQNNTALHFAAENNNALVVQQLLTAKADASIRNASGQTPADLCSSEYVREILQEWGSAAFASTVSLSPKASVAASVASISDRTISPESPSKAFEELVSLCIDGGEAETMKRLLQQSNIDVNKADGKGTTMLMHATWHEHENLVGTLLKAKADPCAKNRSLNSALHYAYEKENQEIIHILLQAGATAVFHDPNELGLIPAQLANSEYLRDEDPTEQVKNLSAAKQVNKTADDTMLELKPMMLSTACINNDVDAVKALLERKADPNERNSKLSTPLMHAVWNQNAAIVDALLRAKSDPVLQNSSLNTALHFAYELNNEDIVNELIVYGGMVALDMENNKGKTPMDMADCEYLRCENLMESPADDSMLSYAVGYEGAKAKEPKSNKLEGVIKACKDDLEDKLYLLLQKKADPNEADKNGSTALMHASQQKNLKIAKMLLEGKADPNLANKRKNTALHFAFQTDNRLMVKLLMTSGAEKSVKKKNKSGKVPQSMTTKAYLLGLDLKKLVKTASLTKGKQRRVKSKRR